MMSDKRNVPSRIAAWFGGQDIGRSSSNVLAVLFKQSSRGILMTSLINDPAPARSNTAIRCLEDKLSLETDVWSVHEGMKSMKPDFILIDVRGPVEFADEHLPGSVNIPYLAICKERLSLYPDDTTFVVYSAGAHCNRADQAALLIARLNRPVKTMVGGIAGWRQEGFALEGGSDL